MQGGYSDWYLPSKDELNELYRNRAAIGGFAEFTDYYSSSEDAADQVWIETFATSGGGAQNRGNKALSRPARLVRSF